MSAPYDDPTVRPRRGGGREPIEVRRGASSTLANPDALPPRLRRRRAFTLVGLTAVAPGAAQIVAGHRRLGRTALRGAVLAVALLVLAGIVYLVAPGFLLGIVAAPWFLGALTAVLLAAALLWAWLFIDAYRLGRPRRLPLRTRRGLALLTALLMLLTSGTLATAAWVTWAGRTAVSGIFGDGDARGPAEGRYNVLLIGSDGGSSRVGVRTDTLMLASVDVRTGRSALFGFARDTENIDFRPGSTMKTLLPQGWNCGDQCLLNGVYQYGMEHKDAFPADVKNPGAQATKEAVEALSGLDIQYYAMVDLVGFRRFVDAVGGIDVVVGRRTPIGGGTSPISGWIEPGEQRLDGYHALWYARSREGASNYDRMSRQKCVMNAMLHQLDAQTVVLKAQDIAAVSGGVVETDIPSGELGRLGSLAMKARGGTMTTVNFTPPLIKPWSYDTQFVHDVVARAIAGDPDPTGATASARATAPTSATDTQRAQSSQTPQSSKTNEKKSRPSATPDEASATPTDDHSFSASDDQGLICAVP